MRKSSNSRFLAIFASTAKTNGEKRVKTRKMSPQRKLGTEGRRALSGTESLPRTPRRPRPRDLKTGKALLHQMYNKCTTKYTKYTNYNRMYKCRGELYRFAIKNANRHSFISRMSGWLGCIPESCHHLPFPSISVPLLYCFRGRTRSLSRRHVPRATCAHM